MKKVITYGTFDLFHKGHYNILKRAKEQGDYLIVGVTGESYDTERGKLSVQDSLAERIEHVKETGFADEIIVEEYLGQKINDIIKYDIDILVIGSDWRGKFDHLNKYCEVRYLERTKDISSTIIREKLSNRKFGIVTEDLYDNDVVMEAKHVSGVHVESVYSSVENVAKDFCDKYELDKAFDNYEQFLDSVDIVYIKTERANRYELIKQAIEKEKHVISDAPCSLEFDKVKELHELSEEKKVVWRENISIVYLQAFNQLLWNIKSNLIGDIISVKAGISKSEYDSKSELDFYDLAFYSLSLYMKLLGTNYNNVFSKKCKNDKDQIIYGLVCYDVDNSIASIEISDDILVDSDLVITGTKGVLIIPSEWWKLGYFKIKLEDEKFKRYSFNFEGNGFRYLLQKVLEKVNAGKLKSQRFNQNENFVAIELLQHLV